LLFGQIKGATIQRGLPGMMLLMMQQVTLIGVIAGELA
jgi:hypothetical protein